MEGYIELHGSKLVLNTGCNIVPIQGSFIVGDKVSLSLKLIYRIPQAVIAIVKSDFSLYFPDLNHLKFSPIIKLNAVNIGDRIILWLTSCGKVIINKIFSNDPKYDEICLLYMYSLIENRKSIKKKNNMNYYTIKDTINHNELDTFTIDPESSIDFDDAISVDVDNKIIYIHIVDITCVSESKNMIDKCFSLYLTENTSHLVDSVDELSLVKGEERNVITVKVIFDDKYQVKQYDIYKSTIIVKNRYNYEQILNEKLEQLNIAFLVKLSNINSNSFFKYNINMHSIKIIKNKVIEQNTNDIAHTLVATVMIICNTIVSKHLSLNKIVIPNRFHSKIIGLDIPFDFTPTENEVLNSYIIVKKFSKAIYSCDQKGHFGLNTLDYVHFTSPMRRYADVIVHNILSGYEYKYDDLNEEIKYINHRSSVVKSIQNLHEKWQIYKYLESNLNKEYTVYITGINPSGILWFMPSLCINGFLHISKLTPKQYWKFTNNKLIGESDREFNLYDKLNVNIKIIENNIMIELN